MKWIGFYNYTVVLTYLSLVSSVLGIKLAYEGHIGAAVLCLVLSGVCDMFDGAVARTKKNRTEDEKNFGIQLDSLCDVICFGLFPAVILYFCGVNRPLGIAALVFYVLCAVIRLAFFNVLEINRQRNEGGCAKEYRGLPVTSSAMILPFFYLLSHVLPGDVANAVYHILPLLVGLLFIADFRIPKLDIGALFHKHREQKEQEEK